MKGEDKVSSESTCTSSSLHLHSGKEKKSPHRLQCKAHMYLRKPREVWKMLPLLAYWGITYHTCHTKVPQNRVMWVFFLLICIRTWKLEYMYTPVRKKMHWNINKLKDFKIKLVLLTKRFIMPFFFCFLFLELKISFLLVLSQSSAPQMYSGQFISLWQYFYWWTRTRIKLKFFFSKVMRKTYISIHKHNHRKGKKMQSNKMHTAKELCS